MQAAQNGNRRLDSWKEIAAHLGRNERTAIRWEKRGLPVHRVPGGQRQAVFAYTQEIDAWLRGQDKNDDNSVGLRESNGDPGLGLSEDLTAAQKVDPGLIVQPRSRSVLLVVIILCLSGLGFVSIFVIRAHTPLAPQPLHFSQVTKDGRAKIRFRTDSTTLYLNEIEGTRAVLVSMPARGGSIRPISTRFANVILEDISKDSQKLLVTSFEGMEIEKPLWIIPAQGGGTPQRVGNILCRSARWSPDNTTIACATGTSIILVNSDGSAPRTLASFPFVPGNPLWSPDGQQLRFVLLDTLRHSTSSWEMPVTNAGNPASPTATKLSISTTGIADWTWIREDKDFAFLDYDSDRKSRLMVIPERENGTSHPPKQIELPVKIETVTGVASGGTNSTLFLMVQNPYRGELLKFDPRRKVLQTFLNGLSAEFLSFSRDGQWMTYINTLDQSLWRSRADGTDALQLTKLPVEVELSSWSPDGSQIAYMARTPGQPWRIYVVDKDGGAPEEASSGNDNQGAPTWSQDGKAISYANVDCVETQNCWVRRIDLATKRAEMLPGSQGMRTARWSPNGKYIAALRPDTYDLMLFDVGSARWTTLADSITGDDLNWSSDSQFIYANNPKSAGPVVERIRIRDGQRVTVMSLASFQMGFGRVGPWVGLTRDNAPILFHDFTTSEVYALDLN
jgi:Tol biopolymer transport system component